MSEDVVNEKWVEQVKGIGKLAWTRCSADIRFILTVVWGSSLIGMVFLSFWMLNAGANTLPLVNTVYFPGAVTTSDALLTALFYAFANTVCTVIFLTVVICLFEYAYHFAYVAYIYDNQSWEVVNMVKRGFAALERNRRDRIAEMREKEYVSKAVLVRSIEKLKGEKS